MRNRLLLLIACLAVAVALPDGTYFGVAAGLSDRIPAASVRSARRRGNAPLAATGARQNRRRREAVGQVVARPQVER